MFNVKYHVHYANVRLLYSDLKMTWSRWRCLDRWRGHLISSGRVKGVQLPPHDNPPGDCQGFLCGELVPLFPIQCGMGLGVFSGNTKTRRASAASVIDLIGADSERIERPSTVHRHRLQAATSCTTYFLALSCFWFFLEWNLWPGMT